MTAPMAIAIYFRYRRLAWMRQLLQGQLWSTIIIVTATSWPIARWRSGYTVHPIMVAASRMRGDADSASGGQAGLVTEAGGRDGPSRPASFGDDAGMSVRRCGNAD